MSVLTREQINAVARADGRTHPGVIDTARAYWDLRERVLALCDYTDVWDAGDYDKGCMDALDAVRRAVEGVET